jgi:hypothetical protein
MSCDPTACVPPEPAVPPARPAAPPTSRACPPPHPAVPPPAPPRATPTGPASQPHPPTTRAAAQILLGTYRFLLRSPAQLHLPIPDAAQDPAAACAWRTCLSASRPSGEPLSAPPPAGISSPAWCTSRPAPSPPRAAAASAAASAVAGNIARSSARGGSAVSWYLARRAPT